MSLDKMQFLKSEQKYDGLSAKTAEFLLREQLCDRATWQRFVDQFRHPIDGGNNGWRGEYWGKMMRGGALVYEFSGNEELYGVLTETVRDMLTVIDAEGRISSFTKETEFRAWDLWCRKYVILGMEYYLDICRDGELKAEIVSFISRAADYVIAHIGRGEGQIHINKATNHWLGLNSSSILEPMVRLYNLTGERKYFDFCTYIVESGGAEGVNIFERAYENVLKPYQYGVSKAYEMMSCFEGLLEYYRVTGIEKYRKAVVNFAKSVLETEVSVIGSCGCTHELFDHTKARQTQFYDGIMQETCVTVTWMKLCSQLLRLTGESVFADAIEHSFYNAYLGSLNENMIVPQDDYITRRFAKEFGEGEITVTPLPFDSYSPLIPGRRGRKVGGFQFLADRSYYGCCVCIGAAGLGVFTKHAILESDGAVVVNFYENGINRLATESGRIVIETETKYPADGRITMKIGSEREFDLRLRVPEWSKKTNLKARDGYANVHVPSGESEVVLELDMSIRETLPESWDLDVLYINTCGTMRPPVAVRHKEEDDRYISLSRGPLTLAADSRLGKDAGSHFSFERKGKKLACRIAEDDNYLLKCEFTSEDGEKFFLVDYQSAGKDWESEIAAWLPV